MSSPVPSKKSAGEERASALGEVIADKYKVLGVLGQGGFGTVYLVEIVAGMVGEKLALKVLSEQYGGNTAVREQFLNEIRVAMKMVDRYIVQIRDVGTTADGRVYYTMDYCRGKALSEILREERRLPYRRAILIILKVLRALRTAHSRGIIHRDLKPANIMVETENGRDSVRVLDFGIATALREPGSEKKGITGSPLYMPPEQFLGETLGFYTDLYAVGAILYECLTGQRPYPGRTARDVFEGLKRGPPTAADALHPELGECPGLSETVMKALERNPERRFQSAKEFFDKLGGFLNEDSPTETPGRTTASTGRRGVGAARRTAGPRTAVRRPLRRRRSATVGPWVLLGLVVLAAAVVAFVLRDKLGLPDLSSFLTSLERSEPLTSGRPAPSPSPEPAPSPGDGAPERNLETPSTEPASPEVDPADTDPAEAVRPGEQELPGTATPKTKPETDELLAAATAALRERDWDGVLEIAGDVIQREPANERALRLLGEAHLELSNLRDAERYLEKAAHSSQDPDLLLMLAELKTRKQPPEWARAESLLELARRQEGYEDQAAILSLLAEVLYKQEKRRELRELLIAAKERKTRFEGLDGYWKELLVDAPAGLWSEAQTATEEARRAYAAGEIEAAIEGASRTVRLATELDLYGKYAPVNATPLGHEMRLLSAEIAIRYPGVAGLDAAAIGRLLNPVSQLIKESPQTASPTLVMKWNYLSGRLHLVLYAQKPSKRELEEAESHLLEARRLARDEGGRNRDTEFLDAVHSWLARVYAHRGDYVMVDEYLRSARDVRDLGEIYEQAWTYFITARKTRADQRVRSYQSAADRLENITTLSSARVPAELYKQSLDLLGRSYLMLGRYQAKAKFFVYAANKFVEARQEGCRTPELYRNLGAAYEEFNRIKAAQTYRELYEQIQTNVCNCLLAAEKFIWATENTAEARNILSDGLNRFPAPERTSLEKALRAVERARARKETDELPGEIEKLRRIACK